MTQTEVQLRTLQERIAHLAQVSEQGWLLQWGDSADTLFEVECKEANALQIEKLDALLTRAHDQALAVLR